jgi:hypothetical protein
MSTSRQTVDENRPFAYTVPAVRNARLCCIIERCSGLPSKKGRLSCRFFPTSLSRRAAQRRVRRRCPMRPTTPADRDLPTPRFFQHLRSTLSESWALSSEICEEAAAACARAAEIKHTSAQCRKRAEELGVCSGLHRCDGIHTCATPATRL